MARHPWRFQCDVPYGETDPDVTVFIGDVFTRDDDSVFVEQSVDNPVHMKLSQVKNALSLIDSAAMTTMQDKQVTQKEQTDAERKAAVESAVNKAQTKARRKAKGRK